MRRFRKLRVDQPGIHQNRGWFKRNRGWFNQNSGCPTLARSLRKGGKLGSLQRVPLTLMLVLPLTLTSGSGRNREGHDLQSCRKPPHAWKSGASAPR